MDAILEATVQVLLDVGKERLTTTRVAARSGVSVGTLYQYFPNRSALLQAALKRHLDEISSAVERVCREQKGKTLREMTTALVTAFLQAKLRDVNASIALYDVSSDVEGIKVMAPIRSRTDQAIVQMFAGASEPLSADTHLVAAMLQAVMSGVSRRLLESTDPEKHLDTLRHELIFLACTYVTARSR